MLAANMATLHTINIGWLAIMVATIRMIDRKPTTRLALNRSLFVIMTFILFETRKSRRHKAPGPSQFAAGSGNDIFVTIGVVISAVFTRQVIVHERGNERVVVQLVLAHFAGISRFQCLGKVVAGAAVVEGIEGVNAVIDDRLLLVRDQLGLVQVARRQVLGFVIAVFLGQAR